MALSAKDLCVDPVTRKDLTHRARAHSADCMSHSRLSVQRTQAGQASPEQHRHVEALGEILSNLNAAADVTEAFPAIAPDIISIAGCERVSLGLLDRSQEWLNPIVFNRRSAKTRRDYRVRVADIPSLVDLLSGRAFVKLDQAGELPLPAPPTPLIAGVHSTVCLPLRGSEAVIGAMVLSWRRPGSFDETLLPVLTQIADAVALGVERGRLFRKAIDSNRRLEKLCRGLVELQEKERRRIACELHDEIGQTVTRIKLNLEMISTASSGAVRTKLLELQSALADLMTWARELTLDLRPPILDDLGLVHALPLHFERYTAQTNVRVIFEHDGLGRRFDPDVETAAYRVVQEALTNVARHARVDSVKVGLWAGRDVLRAQIHDRGIGFDPDVQFASIRNCGLTGMRERVALLGGKLKVRSAPGTGTRLTAEFPLSDPAMTVGEK